MNFVTQFFTQFFTAIFKAIFTSVFVVGQWAEQFTLGPTSRQTL